MRDIYLIDFENVASDGLNGIAALTPEDQVIIFYSNNSNRLTMKMHILIGKSVCSFRYFEVTVGGKNALDHQIATWLGYLIGTNAAQRSYYIVSRDMGYKFVANFWADSDASVNIRCVDSIRSAVRLQSKLDQSASVGDTPEPIPLLPPAPVTASESFEPKAEPVLAKAEPVEETPIEPKPIEPKPVPVEPKPAPIEVKPAPAAPVPQPSSGVTLLFDNTASRSPDRKAEAKSAPKQPQKAEVKADSKQRSKAEAKADSKQESKVEAKADSKQESKSETKPKRRTRSSAAKETPKQEQKEPKESPKADELSRLIIPYPVLQEQHLRQLIADNQKQKLCNHLRKLLGQEKGLALYNDIKKKAWH